MHVWDYNMNREIQGAVSSRSRTGVVVAFSSNRSTVSLLPHPLRVSSTLLHCLCTLVSISLIPQATIPSQVQDDIFGVASGMKMQCSGARCGLVGSILHWHPRPTSDVFVIGAL